MKEAEAAGVVEYGGTPQSATDWVRLTSTDLSPPAPQPRQLEQVKEIPTRVTERDTRFAPLLQVLREEKAAGRDRAVWSETALRVQKAAPSAFQTGHFKQYIEAAVTAGVVRKGGSGLGLWIQLVEEVTSAT